MNVLFISTVQNYHNQSVLVKVLQYYEINVNLNYYRLSGFVLCITFEALMRHSRSQ